MAAMHTLTTSPILFIVFNRPDVTAKVFDAIRHARPPKLYVAGDGPRANRVGEEALCKEVRDVVLAVDWPCQVLTKFNDRNLGCREGVVSALNWFFDCEQEGIVLEDDCLPAPDFFRFCDTLLEYYRQDTRVRHIGGSNFQRGITRGDASYYFSRLTHIWGWASWRRVWKEYDKDLTNVSSDDIETALQNYFGDAAIAARWKRLTTDLQERKIDTWDYQLSIAGFLSNGVAAIPNVNLVTNIGFGEGATHTHDANHANANLAAGSLSGAITHPRHFVPNRTADVFTLNAERKKKSPKDRVKKWLAWRSEQRE